MPFFQNPFQQEFRASMPFGDRQYSLTFSVPANKNQSQIMVSWNTEPYDFSTYNMFTINFAIDPDYVNYATFSVNVAGAIPSATMASEVVSLLNADSNFSAWFTASLADSTGQVVGSNQVLIRPQKQQIKVYITNAGAEQIARTCRSAS